MWHDAVGAEIRQLFADDVQDQVEEMRGRLYARYQQKLGSKEVKRVYMRGYMAKRYAADKAAIAAMREALRVGQRAGDAHEVHGAGQVG